MALSGNAEGGYAYYQQAGTGAEVVQPTRYPEHYPRSVYGSDRPPIAHLANGQKIQSLPPSRRYQSANEHCQCNYQCSCASGARLPSTGFYGHGSDASSSVTSSPTNSDKSISQSSYTSSIFSQASGRSTPLSQYSARPSSPSVSRGSGRPRMQVSSLLTESKQARSYDLEVVQHPQKTAEFGTASSLSRLPLTPPIIVKLTITDRTGNLLIPETELPFLVAHLSLFSADGRTPLDMGSSGTANDPPRRLLYGNLVASPQKLRDPAGTDCIYFVFPDVSIRWRGRFQIGISLVGIASTDSYGMVTIAEQGTLLAEARTRPFDVVAHEDYVAAPLTVLTQCLLRQGVRMYPSMPSHPRSRA